MNVHNVTLRLAAPSILLGALFVTACSSTTSPMFNAYSLDTGNGARTYRVECQGVFASGQTCTKEAEKICGDKPVHVLEKVDQLRADDTRTDPRQITFRCETPAAQEKESTQLPVAAGAVAPKTLLLSGDANFDVNGAPLSAAAAAQLDELLKASGDTTFKTVTVTGYTDSTGSSSHNLKLSGARAEAVMTYLKSHGLHANDYVIRGAGSAAPLASNETASGRAQNRRVEIHLIPE